MTMKEYEGNRNMIIIREFHEDGVEELMIPVIGRKYSMLLKDGDIDFYVDGQYVDSWTPTENALITPPVLKRKKLFDRLVDNMTMRIIERFDVYNLYDNDFVTWLMDRLLFAVLKIMFLRETRKCKDE